MKPVIVTKELVSIGLSVMRGRDWKWSYQDGKIGDKGKVIEIGGGSCNVPDGWVKVEWENGKKYNYRIGNDAKYDLYVYVPNFYDPAPVGRVQLTSTNGKVGDRVVLNQNATVFAKERLRDIRELIIDGYTGPDVRIKGFNGAFMVKSFDICTDQTVKVVETKATGSVAKVAIDDGENIQLKDPSSFKWGYAIPVPEENPVYKFRKGDVVYLNPSKEDSWSIYSGIDAYIPYTVQETKDKTMKLCGVLRWQVQDHFISREDHELSKHYTQTGLTTMPMLGMKDLQQNVVSISENSKPNKNSQNGTNTDYSGTRLNLPAKDLTLKRGERPEGLRLRS